MIHKLEILFAEGGEELFTFHLLPCREFFLFPSVGCSLFTLRAIQPGTSSPKGKELRVKIRNTHFRQLTKVRKAAEDFLCRNNRVVLATRTPGVPLLSKNEYLTDDKTWLSTGESRRLGEYNLFNEKPSRTTILLTSIEWLFLPNSPRKVLQNSFRGAKFATFNALKVARPTRKTGFLHVNSTVKKVKHLKIKE